MTDFALAGSRRLGPLRRFSPNTTDHVGMSQCLGTPLALFDVESRWKRLGDARMQRRGPARNDEAGVALIAGRRSLAGARTQAERGSHCESNLAQKLIPWWTTMAGASTGGRSSAERGSLRQDAQHSKGA